MGVQFRPAWPILRVGKGDQNEEQERDQELPEVRRDGQPGAVGQVSGMRQASRGAGVKRKEARQLDGPPSCGAQAGGNWPLLRRAGGYSAIRQNDRPFVAWSVIAFPAALSEG